MNNKFKIFGHGENSITYQLFTELDRKKLSRLLCRNTDWISGAPKIKEEDIEEVHLFPGFGKKEDTVSQMQ